MRKSPSPLTTVAATAIKARSALQAKGQYNSQEWLLYFIYGYSYGESNGQKDTNDGMLHLRYVHTLADELYDYELFCQTEFNAFEDIRIRNLAGSNLRRKLDTGFDNATPYEHVEKSDFRSTVNLRYKLR